MTDSYVPLILSAAGALISAFAMLCVGVIGWLVRYVLANTERRITQLETKADAHATHIASATAQTASEQRTLTEMSERLGDLQDKFEQLSTQIATFIGRRGTPHAGIPRPDLRAEPNGTRST